MASDITQFTEVEPHIDYLAKDFATFRQLMLDHLSVLAPNWTEQSPADLGHVVVEVLAYAADYLSYYQDAVATEAYLSSARLRRSVRRHARLLDYFLHEGCNARVWVQIAVKEDNVPVAQGVHLLTDLPGLPRVIDQLTYSESLIQAPLVFATLHDIELFNAHNQIPLHCPNPREAPSLPIGSTSAWLRREYVQFLFQIEAEKDSKSEFEDVLAQGKLPGTLDEKFKDKGINFTTDIQIEPVQINAWSKQIEAVWQITNKQPKHIYIVRIKEKVVQVGEFLTVSNLKPGDVVIFDQVLDPKTGAERRDPKQRHPVRLTNVSYHLRPEKELAQDQTRPLVKLEWAEADALPFALAIAPYGKDEYPVAVARGNIVLADHGRRIQGETLPPVLPEVRYRPPLRLPGLTQRVTYQHALALTTPAAESILQDPRQAMPDIRLLQLATIVQLATNDATLLPAVVNVVNAANLPQAGIVREWNLRRDLLNSDRFARDYLVEMEDNGQPFLRFGFGDMGKLPEPGDEFIVDYRVGNGASGNVGPDTIHHLVMETQRTKTNQPAKNTSPTPEPTTSITRIWNPLAAQSGTDPEAIEEVRLHAPYAFRQQREQCITEEDYAEIATRYPGVLQAAARIHYVGLWHVVTIYVRRDTFEPLSLEFRTRLNEFMQRYRQAGYELTFRDPDPVALEVALKIYLKTGQRALIVQSALSKVLNNQINDDGSQGFFYPANFALGKPIYRSNLVTALMAVPGVKRVEVIQFGRADGEANVAEIPIGPLEVAELENDPTKPGRGSLKLEVIES